MFQQLREQILAETPEPEDLRAHVIQEFLYSPQFAILFSDLTNTFLDGSFTTEQDEHQSIFRNIIMVAEEQKAAGRHRMWVSRAEADMIEKLREGMDEGTAFGEAAEAKGKVRGRKGKGKDKGENDHDDGGNQEGEEEEEGKEEENEEEQHDNEHHHGGGGWKKKTGKGGYNQNKGGYNQKWVKTEKTEDGDWGPNNAQKWKKDYSKNKDWSNSDWPGTKRESHWNDDHQGRDTRQRQAQEERKAGFMEAMSQTYA